jgi:hypothetical protein
MEPACLGLEPGLERRGVARVDEFEAQSLRRQRLGGLAVDGCVEIVGH